MNLFFLPSHLIISSIVVSPWPRAEGKVHFFYSYESHFSFSLFSFLTFSAFLIVGEGGRHDLHNKYLYSSLSWP
jgi:hypothetical protein